MTFASFCTCILLVFFAQPLGAWANVTGTSPGIGSILGGTEGDFGGAAADRAGASSLDVTPPFGQDAISQVFPYQSCSSVTDTSPVLPLVKHGFRVSPSRFPTVKHSRIL